MLSNSIPWSSGIPAMPRWIIVHPNNAIEFNGNVSPTLEKCFDLKNQEAWTQYKKVSDSWIAQASDEDIFKYLRGDFSEYFSPSVEYFSPEYTEKLNNRALTFIWSKNPELQEKYPNFEWVSTLTEAQKIWYSPKNNNPWIWLTFVGNDKIGNLSIYTRPSEQDEFTEHFYLIHEDWSAKFHLSQTQSEAIIARQKHETSQKVLNTLIDEANGDPLKIANAFLTDATIKTIQYNLKNNWK